MLDNELAIIATGRTESLFNKDMKSLASEMTHAVTDKRVLVLGGAGSIGSSTVRELVRFSPACVHVIDQNENDLAELTRSLRSSSENFKVSDFRTLPLDYGSAAFSQFVRSEQSYDFVLNFAAIKHVRSEKDNFSILQMFNTNIWKQFQLLKLLAEIEFTGRYFSVSTDKAANPTSLMGATKRIMEHVMFDGNLIPDLKCTITSARFANVAFSNGSLLQSFKNRFHMGQPLAAPENTRRYFVSLQESGQLCTLAAITGPDRHILFPNLDPENHLVEMQLVAEKFIQKMGCLPAIYRDEDAARSQVSVEKSKGSWPLLLTNLNTSGEKPYEEFVATNETVVELNYEALSAVSYLPLDDDQLMIKLIENVKDILYDYQADAPSKDVLKGIIAMAEPQFLEGHKESKQNLDQRV